MAITKRKTGSKKKNEQVESYFFDVEKCKHCPFKDGCYKEGSKTKTFNVKIKDETHIEHMDYINSRIGALKKYITDIKIREYLEDYL